MTPASILIVDDDPALLEALPEALRLRLNGIRIQTCDSAPTAIERIADADFDAIVTDIKMPGMDGLTLLDEIRSVRPETPTLLITGHGEHDLAVQALRRGAYDFIQKPIDRDYFVASLQRAIEMRRLARRVETQKLELARHARVLEHVADGVLLVDDEGIIRLWNSGAAAITSVPVASALGRRVADVLGGWDAVAAIVRQSPAGSAQRGAIVPVEADGHELWLSLSSVDFSDGTVYSFQDVTAERAVDRLKDDFVATASHELRTPLAAIYGAAKTLEQADRALDDGSRATLLRVIGEESERLAGVINDILLTSHLDSGRLHVASERVDAVELAREALAVMRSHADERIELSLVAPEAPVEVVADRDRLRRVLVNILENAIKYSPEGGAVDLLVEVADEGLSFVVRDEGLGIAPDELDRIFDKFYRGDPHLTRGVGGTGLGLYICRELVRRMGGRVSVESEQGAGSSFRVELPLPAAGRTAADDADTAALSAR